MTELGESGWASVLLLLILVAILTVDIILREGQSSAGDHDPGEEHDH